jgi:hypothetical protein
MGQHIVSLYERGGMQVDGPVDAWNGFPGEKMQASHISLMCDFMPSMADTLLRSGGIYGRQSNLRKMEAWTEKNPGVVCELETSLCEAVNVFKLDIQRHFWISSLKSGFRKMVFGGSSVAW